MTEKEVRSNWDKALASVKRGEDLSQIIDWGFYDEDIEELARLHKAGKHKEKILDLLTDCNFHTEAADFEDGNYTPYLKESFAKKAVDMMLAGKGVTESINLCESNEPEEDKVTALLQFLDLEDTPENRERVTVTKYNSNSYEIDGKEFMVCTDEEADEEFHDSIENLIDDVGLSAFPDGIRDYIENNCLDEEPFMEFYEDDTRAYAEDIEGETLSEPEVIQIDGEDVSVTNRLFWECIESGAIDVDDLEPSDVEDGDYVGDEDLVELFWEKHSDPSDEYDDVFDWYSFCFGESAFKQFVEEHNAINLDEVCEYLISICGRGNELSGWDGKEYEEDVNGETYYIYPNDDPKSVK